MKNFLAYTAGLLFTGTTMLNAQVSITFMNESCNNSGDGAIRVQTYSPGWTTQMIKNNVDTSNFTVTQTDTILTGLSAGDYLFYSCGGSDTITNLVTLTAPAPVNMTLATSSNSVNINDNIAFTGSGTNISAYSWSFGDGNNSVDSITNHSYATSGSFLVTLTATDLNGCTGSRTATIDVTDPFAPLAHNNSTDPRNSNSSTTRYNTVHVYSASGSGKITIDNEGTSSYGIRVMNINGQTVITPNEVTGHTELQVSTPGIYIVSIVMPDGDVKTEKVFVQ
ncbi:MAG: PKD domain-containing protein [Bacteroidetes bacterium]|nr:PKD domain-containing protein [Bacteroidota bacterium]